MDRQELFDALAIRLSDVTRRQDVLRLLGRMVLALVVFQVFPRRGRAQSVQPESALVPGCRLTGQKCSGQNDCCSTKCNGDHRCGCINKGGSPIVETPLGPLPVKALCCTNKINAKTEKCR